MTRVQIIDEITETLVHWIPIHSKDSIKLVTRELLQRQEQTGCEGRLVLVHQGSVRVIQSVEEIPVPAMAGGVARAR